MTAACRNCDQTPCNCCPGCGARNPKDEHLMREYLDLNKASFNRLFGHNARSAQDQVADMLIARDITEIPNIFGSIPVRFHRDHPRYPIYDPKSGQTVR